MYVDACDRKRKAQDKKHSSRLQLLKTKAADVEDDSSG